MRGIYIYIMEGQREAYTGSPQKQSFCGVKILPHKKNYPLSFSRRKIRRVKERLRLSYITNSPSLI